MCVEESDHADVTGVLIKGYWYNVAKGSFRRNGDAWNEKCHEWVGVYRFDYRLKGQAFGEPAVMQVSGPQIEAVQINGAR